MSYDLFFNNILPTEMKHQVPFNSVATKAKALFTHYVNTSTEATPDLKTYYNGLRPSQSLINDVVYYINNTLMPAQSYNPSNYGDKVIQTNELQKALRAANIPVVNLGDNKAGNLNIYTNTFLTARELARGDFIYDLSNAEPELRLEFSGSREFNIRTYSFVFSKKVVTIGPQGVKVVL